MEQSVKRNDSWKLLNSLTLKEKAMDREKFLRKWGRRQRSEPDRDAVTRKYKIWVLILEMRKAVLGCQWLSLISKKFTKILCLKIGCGRLKDSSNSRPYNQIKDVYTDTGKQNYIMMRFEILHRTTKYYLCCRLK